MSDSSPSSHCPQCGAATPNAPEGLCPRCLMAQVISMPNIEQQVNAMEKETARLDAVLKSMPGTDKVK